jgi:hypothetical protein
MKKIFFLASLLTSIEVFAGIDGIYYCAVNARGAQVGAYITVNSRGAQSIFAIAAVTPSNSFYGYGIGTVEDNIFSGQTMFLQPFSFTVGDDSLIGSVGVVSSGVAYTATSSCQKVW